MRFDLSPTALEIYEGLPPGLRKKAAKQFEYLASDLRHPSLHAKKYNEANGIWQGRIDRSWRFYFVIIDDLYFIFDIRVHPK